MGRGNPPQEQDALGVGQGRDQRDNVVGRQQPWHHLDLKQALRGTFLGDNRISSHVESARIRGRSGQTVFRGEGSGPQVAPSGPRGCIARIESRPDVCGGEACIVRTRIPVWLLENARRSGVSERVLLASYPAEDLVNAWNYARSYASKIDRH